MNRRNAIAALFAAALAGAGASAPASAENYPARPIEIVVPFGPGGGADQMARMLGKLLEADLGTSLPVINVPGGTGAVGLSKVMASPADGYQLVVMTGEVVGLAAHPKPKWTTKDIIPLAILMRQPSGLFVTEASRFKSWADLAAEAKAKPGTIKVAHNGFGSPDDIVVNFLASKGIKLTTVPYAKPGERYSSLLGGHSDVLYEQAGDLRTFIEGKQMRPLIFFGDKGMPQFPGIPASKDLGLDIQLDQIRMIGIRADTDPAKVKKLAEALQRAAKSPEFTAYLDQQWSEAGFFMSGDTAVKFVQDQIDLMKRSAQ
ncbi:MAG TPA: tripartite tricarboxylate transporter substrate binding protein [Pelomicrobium sp.]|nr:tripartite tricarboxylate transporter substrate binding protein [Pelomicrobium sp.]